MRPYRRLTQPEQRIMHNRNGADLAVLNQQVRCNRQIQTGNAALIRRVRIGLIPAS